MEIWSFFVWWESTNPNPLIMKNTVAPSFLSQSECLILLQKIFLQKGFIILIRFFLWQFRIMIEPYRISFGYWWLVQFLASVSLKTKHMFLHIFKYVSTSCLYQFTLYIIYYIFYIYNLHYILYFSVVF